MTRHAFYDKIKRTLLLFWGENMRKREKQKKQKKSEVFFVEIKDSFSKKSRAMAIMYIVLTLIVTAVLIGQFFHGNYENCFTCILTLILFLIPTFVDRKLKITLPQTLEVIIVLFVFAAEILGEINAFYLKIWWWDTMLHVLNGFLMAAIGFSMVDIFNQSKRFKFEMSPLFVALVAFCFSMTIGVVWEFFEFSMDVFTHTDMQKDTVLNAIATVDLNESSVNIPVIVKGIEEVILQGEHLTVDGIQVENYSLGLGGYLDIGLYDTMKDLIVNFVGAVVFSIIGYFYIKNRGKGTFAKRFIPIIQNDKDELSAVKDEKMES